MDVKNNSLINTFQINKKDIITIVGAGGKTSLMLSASSYLRKDHKVLVTTTTDIYMRYKKYIWLKNLTREENVSVVKE